MPDRPPPPAPPLEAHAKVWLERDGEVVISDFRAALLEAVAAEGSVAAAAHRLDLPNRTAWKKLREMEAAAGIALLESDSGGAHGGRSVLTDAARRLLGAFRRLNSPVTEVLADEFTRESPSIDATLARSR